MCRAGRQPRRPCRRATATASCHGPSPSPNCHRCRRLYRPIVLPTIEIPRDSQSAYECGAWRRPSTSHMWRKVGGHIATAGSARRLAATVAIAEREHEHRMEHLRVEHAEADGHHGHDQRRLPRCERLDQADLLLVVRVRSSAPTSRSVGRGRSTRCLRRIAHVQLFNWCCRMWL